MSHKQIADEMGCSVATVNVYAKRILDATGQDNTIAAAVFMIRSAEWLTHIMGKD
jgi:DNA-binding NarL/FixJ family response regulator